MHTYSSIHQIFFIKYSITLNIITFLFLKYINFQNIFFLSRIMHLSDIPSVYLILVTYYFYIVILYPLTYTKNIFGISYS